MFRATRLLPFVPVWAMWACSAAPVAIDPPARLDLAEQQLEAGNASAAEDTLGEIDVDALSELELPRYKVLLSTALRDTGSLWQAFAVIRRFTDDHRYSDYTTEAEKLTFSIGKALIQSTASYWIFGSDKDDGEIVLSEFVSHYPTASDTAEALKLLGGLAYDEGRFLMARDRYRQIIQEHPSSEWAQLARLRLAYSGFRSLEGPEYDLTEMELTQNELKFYLKTEPERPEFRQQAAEALATTTTWIAQRHLTVAEFYRTVGNLPGERVHLRKVATDFPDLPEGRQALERLRELPPAAGAPDPGGAR